METGAHKGESLQFDPEQVEQFVQAIAELKPGKSVGLFVFRFFVVIVVVIVGAIYLITKFVLR